LTRGITFSVRHITKISAVKNRIEKTGDPRLQFGDERRVHAARDRRWLHRRDGDERVRFVRVRDERVGEPRARRLDHTAYRRFNPSACILQRLHRPWHARSIADRIFDCEGSLRENHGEIPANPAQDLDKATQT
jgi:hypothetical protein